jgi:protein tyrosine/serine phosphatase
MSSRDIPITGVFNLRDVGGHETRDGRRTRPGTLFRSSALHELASVRGLAVRTVIDLRSSADIERDATRLGPIREHVDVRRVALPMLQLLRPGESASEVLNKLHGAGISAGRYSGYLELGRGSIRDAFHLLAEPGVFPALLHCTAGKDRTGVMIALVLDVLGVSAETIVEDYAKSNESLDTLIRELRSDSAGASESDLALFRAPPEAMRGFLEGLHLKHGSARGYLASIGVASAVFDALEAALLAPAGQPAPETPLSGAACAARTS